MKFLIAICLLASVASAINLKKVNDLVRKPAPGANATQCIYKPDDSHMSCKMGEEIIECPTEHDLGVFSEKFEKPANEADYKIWGIGKASGVEEGEIKTIMYSLFRRSLDNSTYKPSFVMFEEKKVPFVLGCGKEQFVRKAGLRVVDCMCFERMHNMLKRSFEMPHSANMIDESKNVTKVELAGEVMIMDEQIRKRWLFGWGWGLGLGLGWGFGGLGWGFPFWG
jgi:hypothetical protein